MTKELMLLRHGKSDWQVSVSDFERPLKDRGKREAQRMGAWIRTRELIPDLILSSNAERALVTAEKCSKAMGLTVFDIQQSHDLYAADHRTLTSVISNLDDAVHRVLIVGHNPGLEDLLYHLLGSHCPQFNDGKVLPTASLSHLSLQLDTWQALPALLGDDRKGQSCKVLHHVRGRSLSEKFPYFPARSDKPNQQMELRDRPAYYYSQSSAIPFRVQNGKLEILLIGSSSRKRWLVPKGIIEPGLTPAVSAQKEAVEEAGIEGSILDRALGHYQHEKWGAICDVEVFAMKVENQLPEEKWQERHRGRQWFAADMAKTLISQIKLRPLIDELSSRIRSISTLETKQAERESP